MGKFTTPIQNVTYAGIDFHKKFSVVTLGDANGEVLLQHKLWNDEKEIVEFFKPYRHVICAIEACRGYEWFLDLLTGMGIRVELCNTFRAKFIVQTKNKNDKVDSRKLMQLLSIGYLPTCYAATSEERALRARLRWRQQIVKHSTKLKVLITTNLDKENRGQAVNDLFSKKGLQYVSAVELEPARRLLVDDQLQMLESMQEKIREEDRWISQQVKQNPACERLLEVPGFGPITAVSYTAELGNPERFKRAAQVARYFGVTPSEHSSGGKRQLGPITREGSPYMRGLLVQSAWRAIRVCPELRRKFDRISHSAGKCKAIVAIARLLAEIAFHVVKDGKPFDARLLTEQR